jgi:hypothetical protein
MNGCRLTALAFILLIAGSHLTLNPFPFGVTVQSPVGSVCVTPYLQCPLTVPTPVGTPCFCMTSNGNVPGMAR